MSATTKTGTPQPILARRGELMAELFLQELQPAFLAQAARDLGYDFLVGFTNSEGGLNTYAVEVKATEQSVEGKYRMPAAQFRRLAHSNLPALLLVAEVKNNQLYYAWLNANSTSPSQKTSFVSVPVTEVKGDLSAKLRKELTGKLELAQAA